MELISNWIKCTHQVNNNRSQKKSVEMIFVSMTWNWQTRQKFFLPESAFSSITNGLSKGVYTLGDCSRLSSNGKLIRHYTAPILKSDLLSLLCYSNFGFVRVCVVAFVCKFCDCIARWTHFLLYSNISYISHICSTLIE